MTRSKLESWIAPAIVFALALLLYAINLDRPPHPDELHHVLAAQRLLETGHPLIGQGEYWRGILYTWLVAFSYEIFGEGLASARIPAVVFVALIAPALFLWIRREAGPLAAWITSILFITSPFTVEIAQFSRFYSLQMFAFTTGTVSLYYAAAPGQSIWRRLSLGFLSIALLALAIWLQVTTFIGLVGIVIWIFGALVLRFVVSPDASAAARKTFLIVILLAVSIVVVVVATRSDQLEWAWQRYQMTPLFAAENADEFWFYHLRFFVLYPTLWTLVGIFAVFAVIRIPRLGWLAVTIFGVSFLLASIAAQKGTRYFCYAQPFIAIIWGLGLAHVLPDLRRFAQSTRQRLAGSLAIRESSGELSSRAFVGSAIAIVFLTNPFWLRTATVIGNVSLPFETPTTDWRAARETLAPWTARAEIMITTEELGAIYFLGRSDVRFSPNKLAEIPEDQRFEFGIDRRIGRPLISRPESLERLMECFESGLIVGPIEHWGKSILIGEGAQAVIRRHARPIEVPRKSHLYAWGWSRDRDVARPAYCAELERFSGLKLRQGSGRSSKSDNFLTSSR